VYTYIHLLLTVVDGQKKWKSPDAGKPLHLKVLNFFLRNCSKIYIPPYVCWNFPIYKLPWIH